MGVRTYRVAGTIAAPAQVLWSIVSDVLRWPERLETVDDVLPLDGEVLAAGRRFRVRQPGLAPATWTVSVLDPPRRFVWTASQPGLVMEADHRITGEGGGSVRLDLSFSLQGPLMWPVAMMFSAKIQRFISTELSVMKRLAEAGA